MGQESHVYPFKFTGSGGEYFRIWIVNLALTILTLGIYSAWAKVRRKRYFTQHSYLAGHNFDYLANPVSILKGRLLAGALFLIYALSSRTMPPLAQALLLCLFLATPWIVTRSLQFNAHYTRHRGLAFHFHGTVGEAAKVYILWGFLSLITLGLAVPYAMYRKTAFYAGNHAFGASRTVFKGRPGTFYKIGLVTLALLIVPMLLLVSGFAAVIVAKAKSTPEMMGLAGLVLFAGIVMFYLSLPLVLGYVRARTASVMFNATRLATLGFVSRHGAWRLIRLYFVNLILIIFTLGLFTPWAQVRLVRYWLENLDVVGPEGGLDGFVAASGAEVNATGLEMADVFDIDIALT
jgi:uncharacterized membrane protein YjgN (DUF898 family)